MTYGGSDLDDVPAQSWNYNADELVDDAVQLDSDTTTYTSAPGYDSAQYRNWVSSNTNPPNSSDPDTYEYNPNGELASDAPPSGASTEYGYNGDSELTSEATDVDGFHVQSETFAYTPNGERCWSIAGTSSDGCGNPPVGATGYAWNDYNELCWTGELPSSATPSCGSPPSDATTYTYDGSGLRITASSGSTTDYFTWDISDSSAPQLLEDGTYAYIYGPSLFNGDAPIEQIKLSTENPSYLTSAPSGVQFVLGQSGAIKSISCYTTYGTESAGCSNDSAFGFSGGYTDPTGLIYMLNRYYDPDTGSF